ncbi:MAG: DNA translocase FtsK 4TM domain-containing protein [Proteobacteria bacterium]|nr:DNA translocase FtsK 4TM domain-containing protein [Pseudomonadota bacterium]
MARLSSETHKTPFLPKGVSAFIHRRMTETAGLVLMVMAAMLLAAFVTYSPDDPSFNRAVEGPIANLMGRPGAFGADLLLQSLGLAGMLPGLALAAWGYQVAAKRGLRLAWLRVVLLPLTLLLAAAAAAAVTPPESWPLRAGLGGYFGSWALGQAVAAATALQIAADARVIGFFAGAAAVTLLLPSMGMTRHGWMISARAAMRLIFAAGGALAWLGRNGLKLTGGVALRARNRIEARHARVEPYFDTADTADTAGPGLAGQGRAPAAGAPRAVAEAGLIAPKARPTQPGKRARAQRQTTLDLIPGEEFQTPPLDLLDPPPEVPEHTDVTREALERNADLLITVLEDFGIRGKIIKVRPGPVVTLYELEPAPGIKSSRVIGLADDIARSLSALSARIAVVPGRNVIGIEIPNTRRESVYLRELLASEAYERTTAKLALVLGKDISGAPVIADLGRMPHLLIAGTTGSGKSVAINTMILSLLYRLSPDEFKFIMIDPKMLELSVYDGIPHLLAPVVTEPDKAVIALRWVVREMEDRYRALSQLGVRNITSYNARLAEARKRGEALTRTVQTGFDADTGEPVFEDQPLDLKPLPYIVVIVDEMADLMLLAGKDVEGAVHRLSQMARAAGIHLIMATQRPSVDVITGTIKANLPTRVSFQVTSKIDSRTILGEQGAEQLLGSGDMLYMAGGGRIIRVHGPFVSDQEVEAVVTYLKRQGSPDYIDDITDEIEFGPALAPGGGTVDAVYDEAMALVLRERKASTSFIQRHLQIGYNRAARIIETMEADGVISAANHVGRRQVLVRGMDEAER